MTSATEELRRLLDERGVEWQAPNNCQRDEITHFSVSGDYSGTWWEAYEMSEGTLQMSSEIYDELTPAQVIAATLGSEREKALEELVQDWQALYEYPDYGDCVRLRKRMQELGIEVIDE